MPWTFAHPAAVLPLRRFCPSWLNFAALIIGSLTPDLGYYFGLFELARLAHSFAGSLLVCLPSGLVLLGVFCLLRKPLWFLLPQPHRAAIEPVAEAPLSLRPAAVLAAGMSIVIGAWTHNAWDSMTHKNGWVVIRVALLREPVSPWGIAELSVYHILQHFSTLVGVAILVVAYRSWLRRHSVVISPPCSERDDIWRYALLTVMTGASLLVAVSLAFNAAAAHVGLFAWRIFVFRTAVYGGAVFISSLILCSVICDVVLGNTRASHRL